MSSAMPKEPWTARTSRLITNIVFAWLPLSNEDRSPDSKYVLTKLSTRNDAEL